MRLASRQRFADGPPRAQGPMNIENAAQSETINTRQHAAVL